MAEDQPGEAGRVVMARNLSFLLCARDGEGQAGIASIGDYRFWAIIERQKHTSIPHKKPVGARSR
jgi:hypothetical protein